MKSIRLTSRMRIFCVLIAVLCTSLSGCKQSAVSLDVSGCADALQKELTWQDTLTKVEDRVWQALYSLTPEDVKQADVRMGTAATAEEIAVFEAADEAAAARIRTALEQRVADQTEAFTDYHPEELKKLGSPLLEVRDSYIVFCLTDDLSSAREVMEQQFKAAS